MFLTLFLLWFFSTRGIIRVVIHVVRYIGDHPQFSGKSYKQLEDTKGVFINGKLKEENTMAKKEKRTNNGLHKKLKIEKHEPH